MLRHMARERKIRDWNLHLIHTCFSIRFGRSEKCTGSNSHTPRWHLQCEGDRPIEMDKMEMIAENKGEHKILWD